jgi:hypothetical protein
MGDKMWWEVSTRYRDGGTRESRDARLLDWSSVGDQRNSELVSPSVMLMANA